MCKPASKPARSYVSVDGSAAEDTKPPRFHAATSDSEYEPTSAHTATDDSEPEDTEAENVDIKAEDVDTETESVELKHSKPPNVKLEDVVVPESQTPQDAPQLTYEQLFGRLSSLEICAAVAYILPALNVSSPAMRDFQDLLNNAPRPPLEIPKFQRSPTNWPSTNHTLDGLWEQAVHGEKNVMPTSPPSWLNTNPSRLCKPFGSLEDRMMWLSSYPTEGHFSTVHHNYGVQNDLSNISMFTLYAKFGLHVANQRPDGVFHHNIFPRRLDRKKMDTGTESRVLQEVPKPLANY